MKRALLAAIALAACSSPTTGNKQDMSGNNGNPDLSTASDVDLSTPPPRRDMTTTNVVDMTAADDLSADDMNLGDLAQNDLTGSDFTVGNNSDLRRPDLAGFNPDLLGATAWGQPCTAGTTCTAPNGDIGYCSLAYGHPICLHTCDALPEYTLCEGGAGICASDGVGNTCFPKCGDATSINCAAGSSCAYVGFRTSNGRDVGLCLPDCGSGADACTGAGRACDTVRRFCADTTCPGGCLSGSTCTAGVCTPSSPKAIYAACTPSTVAANGCASDVCFAVGASPGFCGVFCNSDNADIVCGAGGVCWGDNNRTLANEQVSGDVTGNGLGQFFTVGGRTSGACVKKCNTIADCPTGAYCAEWNGVRGCLFEPLPATTLPAAGTGTPGQLCRASAQCASGTCALATGYLDGVCTKALAAVCPGGTTPSAANANVCLLDCDATMPLSCAGSHVCDDVLSTPSQCQPALVCRSNADCTAGFTCDPNSGECLNAPLPGSGAIGTTCTASADCAGDFCLTAGVGFPSGYCSATCTQLPDFSDTCPSGSICVGLGNFAVGSVGGCFDLCDASVSVSKFGACRSLYKCTALAANANVGFCEPM